MPAAETAVQTWVETVAFRPDPGRLPEIDGSLAPRPHDVPALPRTELGDQRAVDSPSVAKETFRSTARFPVAFPNFDGIPKNRPLPAAALSRRCLWANGGSGCNEGLLDYAGTAASRRLSLPGSPSTPHNQ